MLPTEGVENLIPFVTVRMDEFRVVKDLSEKMTFPPETLAKDPDIFHCDVPLTVIVPPDTYPAFY